MRTIKALFRRPIFVPRIVAGAGWTYNTEHTADANTIVLYHMEDNAASTTVTDSSGNSYDGGSTNNTSTYSTASGKFNRGFYINTATGNTTSLSVAGFQTAMTSALTGTYTAEIYFKCDISDWSTHTDHQTLCLYWVNASNYVGIGYNKTTNAMQFNCVLGGTSDTASGAGGTGVDGTSWMHYAQTIDTGAADEVRGFYNGTSIANSSGLGTFAGTGTLYVGQTYDGTAVIDGIADEFAISDTVRYSP